jgi:hypothetical protein
VPLTAAADGRSGRRSITDRRKAKGQSVNDDTLEGERDRGGASATLLGYDGAVTPGPTFPK